MLTNLNKWQRMADIVNQHGEPEPTEWQFKKLCASRLLVENILTFLLQYIGLTLVDGLTSQTLIPLWFASGTACAFVFMRGLSVLPGIFLGCFSAYYLSTHLFAQSSASAAIDTVQAFLLFWFSHRYISPTLIFYTVRKWMQFVICSFIVTAISTLALLFFHHRLHNVELSISWWLGNLSGVLVFALTILTWDFYYLQMDDIQKINKLKIISYYGLLFVSVLILLCSQHFTFSVITLAMTLLISLEFGWCGAIIAVFIFGLLLNFSTYVSTPLFANSFARINLIYMQSILIITTIIGLAVAMSFKDYARLYTSHINAIE